MNNNPSAINESPNFISYKETDTLIYDSFLAECFDFDRVELTVDENFTATFTVKTQPFNIEAMRNHINAIYKAHPEYPHDKNLKEFAVLHNFGQFAIGIIPPEDESITNTNASYVSALNREWVNNYGDMYVNNFMKFHAKKIVTADSVFDPVEASFTFVFTVGNETMRSKEELIKSFRYLDHLLLHFSVGLSCYPKRERHFYGNSQEYLITHPVFGRIPAGLYYIDFSNWNGESKVWTKENLFYTGD